MAFQFQVRKKANVWTDQRAKIILEVLGAMRVVKYFSYEIPFLKRRSCMGHFGRYLTVSPLLGIFDLRKHELHGIRKIQFARSAK